MKVVKTRKSGLGKEDFSSILGYTPTEYESGQDKKIGPR